MKGRGSEAQGPRLPTKLITPTSPSPEPDDISARLHRTSQLDCVCACVCQQMRLEVETSSPVKPCESESKQLTKPPFFFLQFSLNVFSLANLLFWTLNASSLHVSMPRVCLHLCERNETDRDGIQSCKEQLTTCSYSGKHWCRTPRHRVSPGELSCKETFGAALRAEL